jgi:dTDP-4-dehydrorhamnose reductase
LTTIEMWGGHECTVNRTGEIFHDQTRRSGHHDRIDDLDRFASLGLQALRYPLLWERVSPDQDGVFDWRWTDERLGRLRELGLRPIAGLLHHGGGPKRTNLLDPEFPASFAAYARAVAERYPWITDWTPINEPLTTARFSALYGHWHPHLSDETAFWRAVLNQIDGVRLAMAEIRAVIPEARLIQTEDFGRTYATAGVAPQAEFDNARRWMTWDLLCGDVRPGHALWDRLARLGFGDRLEAIAQAPCPPDILGVNHYLTSDRFLDERVADYPAGARGGNGQVAYADVEAIRALLPAPGGLESALEEVWARYRRPIAVTESHNGCTREEQVRWLRESWETAERLSRRGVDIRAVTAWALLGSHDWNSLLTRSEGHYEAGAFDVTARDPRPTAVADEIRRLATGSGEAHPATHGPGWWRRDIRLAYRPVFRPPATFAPRAAWSAPSGTGPPLLIAGATGVLGQAFARACEWRGLAYELTDRSTLSLDDEDSIASALDRVAPWAVVNAAGWVRVDEAERQIEACFAANHAGAARLARACAERRLPFVGFSSDMVFNGAKVTPYLEADAPTPLNVYGASKAQAERRILALGGAPLMIRTAAFFSPYDPHNFAAHVHRTLAAGQTLAAADVVVSPTYASDLVDAALDLLIDGVTGVRHLVNDGAVSWAGFARKIAEALDLDPALVVTTPAAKLGWTAVRPPNASMASQYGPVMPSLDDAIQRYARIVRSAAPLPIVHASDPPANDVLRQA